MRARFILGVTREDFAKEVQRTVELFELAQEAFNGESDEVESKLKHFCKGVQEELGAQFLPAEYRTESPRPQPLDPHPFPVPEPMPGPEPDEPEEPDEEKMSKIVPEKPKVSVKKQAFEAPELKKVDAPKVEIKKAPEIRKEVKIEKPKAKKIAAPKVKISPAKKAEPKAKPVKAEKPKKASKNLFFVRWVKEFIWGDE
jgi:hypothetical protein